MAISQHIKFESHIDTASPETYGEARMASDDFDELIERKMEEILDGIVLEGVPKHTATCEETNKKLRTNDSNSEKKGESHSPIPTHSLGVLEHSASGTLTLGIVGNDPVTGLTRAVADSDSPLVQQQKHDALSETQRLKNTPSCKRETVFWCGERGNSLLVPVDKHGEVAKILDTFGVEGIEYTDGKIDLSPVAVARVRFDDVSGVKNIIAGSMLVDDLNAKANPRKAFTDEVRKAWQKLAVDLIVSKLNEDAAFSSQLGMTKKDEPYTEADVSAFLSSHALTLHESPDCDEILLVPTVIHAFFTPHSGGTAEMAARIISGDHKL